MKSTAVAGLSVGSNRARAVLLQVESDPICGLIARLLGVGEAELAGMHRDVVMDVDTVASSIRLAIRDAEHMAGKSVKRVYAGMAGEHVHSGLATGVVAVDRPEIHAEDVSRAHEVARAVLMPLGRELLHEIPRGYTVDHQPGITNPVGMAGTRLETETFIITGALSATTSLKKAVTRAGYNAAGLVSTSLALPLALLTAEEREAGAALLDLGSATVSLSVFSEGAPLYISTVPWGIQTIVGDLAQGLSLSFDDARLVFKQHGAALSELVNPGDTLELPGGEDGSRQVKTKLVAHIIESRLEEIFSLVGREIQSQVLEEQLLGGVVLTGSAAKLPGADVVAERALGVRARVAAPGEGLVGLTEGVRDPKFARATALALWGGYRDIENQHNHRNVLSIYNLLGWLKDFF